MHVKQIEHNIKSNQQQKQMQPHYTLHLWVLSYISILLPISLSHVGL